MRPEPGQVQAAAVSPAPTTTPTTESIRSSLPPSKLSAESYPRPAWVRVLRRILQLWWLAFALYPANALFNLYSLVAHSGFSALLNSGNLMQALLLDQLVPLLVTSPAVVVPVLGIVGLLILGGHWAQTDRQRERQVLAERAAQQARAAEREAVVQQARAAVVAAVSDLVQQQLQTVGTTASHEVAQPQGPPFDEGLLPRPAHFVGREDDVAWVRSRLGERGSVTALLGMGGLGKTTLASMAVQRAHGEERFADGIAVVLCQDLTDATELLRRVLARFDPYRRTPDASTLPELAEAASRTLRGKDALVVLDNLEPALAVAGVLRPLEAAGLTLLLTARQALPRDVVPIEASRQLQLLSDEDCLTLFAQTLGRGSPDALSAAEHAAARRIIEALGRHTLAVKIAAAYAADVRRDLGALAGELEQEGEQALELADGEAPRALARIFAQSTEALPPDARRFFAACAAFATPEFGRQAALTLGRALGYASPETSLNLLVLRALLEASVADRLPDGSDRERLRFHPLLRAFCESLFARWGTQDQEVAKRAAAVHYAACASSWPQTALAADEANIIGALAWTCAHDENELTAAICDGMQQFWFVRARTHDSLHFLPLGIAACEATMAAYSQTHRTPNGELPDEQRLVRLLGSYGEVLTRTGQMDTAAETLEKALKLARQIHYRQGEAVDLSRLGEVAWLRGHMEEAESFARQALAIRREVHDRQGEATDLSGLEHLTKLISG